MDENKYEPPLRRWHAVVHYRADDGTVEVEYELQELYELHDLVELGPHWGHHREIEVFRVNHSTDEKLTVERSKQI